MAVTHQTDTEQRVVGMNFTRDGNILHITAPNGSGRGRVAWQGYYLLFIISNQGVPSVGKFLKYI